MGLGFAAGDCGLGTEDLAVWHAVCMQKLGDPPFASVEARFYGLRLRRLAFFRGVIDAKINVSGNIRLQIRMI